MKEKKEPITFVNTEKFIFDMDGTMYQLDGENGTFKGSTLNRKVISNSILFVLNRERCGLPMAKRLIEMGLQDSIGISNFLAKRYGISRSDYFDVAWNIDPKAVIKDFEVPKMVIQRLSQNGKQLILLTSAPRIWMENITNELGLANCFERKFKGEMFGKKDEIFRSLSGEFNPNTMISIGDQFETDLKPAQELGMRIFHVEKPGDLIKLI